jgi:hypothetical protein
VARPFLGRRVRISISLASADADAMEVAARMVRESGFERVIVGPLVCARDFDPGTPVYNTGMTGRDLALRARRRAVMQTIVSEESRWALDDSRRLAEYICGSAVWAYAKIPIAPHRRELFLNNGVASLRRREWPSPRLDCKKVLYRLPAVKMVWCTGMQNQWYMVLSSLPILFATAGIIVFSAATRHSSSDE